MKSLVLYSRFSPDECVERLRVNVETSGWSLFRCVSDKSVAESLLEGGFEIRKLISRHNCFHIHLCGSMERHADGTRIDCKVGIPLGAELFLYLFFVLLGGLIAQTLLNSYLVFLVPPALLAILFFHRRLGRSEEAFLTGFLIETLEAVPEPPREP